MKRKCNILSSQMSGLRRVLTLVVFVVVFIPVKAQFYSVHTDLVKAATGSFYLEGAISNSLKWSTHLGVEYNPWTFKDNKKIKNFSITPGVRYWMDQSFTGAFVSMNALYSRYNFTRRKYRYDGNGGGLGATFGYAFPIAMRWNIELEGGGGFLWGRHSKYDCKVCGTPYGKESRMFFTPKLELNVAYLF